MQAKTELSYLEILACGVLILISMTLTTYIGFNLGYETGRKSQELATLAHYT